MFARKLFPFGAGTGFQPVIRCGAGFQPVIRCGTGFQPVILAAAMVLYGSAAMHAAAQTPLGTGFTFQGQLNDNGQPANAEYDFLFRLHDAAAGGNQVSEDLLADDVAVEAGLFTRELDFVPLPNRTLFDGNERWVEVAVRPGNGGGPYTPLSPRQKLTATPYALQARGIFTDDAGRVGVGTTEPKHRLHVSGDFRADARAALGNDAYIGMGGGGPWPEYDRILDFSHEVTDFSSSLLWSPILSTVTLNPNVDLIGENSTQIYSNSFTSLVDEACDNDIGFITGLEGAAGHRGSGFVHSNLGGMIGGLLNGPGEIQWNFGIVANAGCGHGSTGNIVNNTGIKIDSGLWGDSGSIQNNKCLSIGRPGTVGPIDTNYGIYLADQNVAQTTNYAIYSDGGDVYFDGDLEVTGTLSKGGGSFKIDHPLDPANKYLYHSFVESPDMMNVYNGNATTDGRGYAVIELPEWFEALNRDFRYQLTVIDAADGDEFVQVKVAREIQNNRFTIRSSAGGAKMSWQVTGIRRDAWAQAHRIPVEVEKGEHERGRYQHPKLYGQPVEMGVDFDRTRELRSAPKFGDRRGSTPAGLR